MEYKFKLTIEEYSTALKLLDDVNIEKQSILKLVRKCVIGGLLFLTILYTLYFYIKYNAYYGILTFLVLGFICVIIFSIYSYLLRPERINKNRLKSVKKQIAECPTILDWQIVKINEDVIEYIFNKKSLKTNLVDVGRVIEEDGVILILACDGAMCAIIPCSCFIDIDSKKNFINNLNVSR
ncbi:Uncharacterised protein [[Clostridium] sordellii]|uniref:YcxB-like protein domain-containing protein n=1 Tax=Paraclostridium sordellii TaxID=1505 RepID=Q84IL3_PARSO|nr:hypothetical protein [Paeniclostridium sordellii]CEJ73117.1 hypothetical protein ATCC9714_10051 [[Clostridium] sordellii] [Paeniclostridium sordellii]CEN68670.1 Uncharacterised protein [[Clostridium] sordellii] [Paeniclostridium sordellii]CEN71937.1 Uncharacterised protein [[Clostridium] sordellii] [Paeniclostridium sordellii]CEO22735.1 Uncharacterised protein [[Clostridium] sordellii] [Paeniclostridium sordellii]CEP76470.1 Uncharacterised protein [[Clostridium] sordellii] [Paeniclostridium